MSIKLALGRSFTFPTNSRKRNDGRKLTDPKLAPFPEDPGEEHRLPELILVNSPGSRNIPTEADEIQALRDEIYQYELSESQLRAALFETRAQKHMAIARLHSLVRTPANRLSSAILEIIFGLVDKMTLEWGVMLVCKRWRRLALGLPELWSTVDLMRGPVCAKAYSKRAKGFPLAIELDLPDLEQGDQVSYALSNLKRPGEGDLLRSHQIERLFTPVLPFIATWTSLHVRTPDVLGMQAVLSICAKAGGTRTLQSLELIVSRSSLGSDFVGVEQALNFENEALERVVLVNMAWQWSPYALGSVRSLSITLLNERTYDLPSYFGTLVGAACLQSLTITISPHAVLNVPDISGPSIVLPFLSHLVLNGSIPPTLLRLFNTPKLRRLDMNLAKRTATPRLPRGHHIVDLRLEGAMPNIRLLQSLPELVKLEIGRDIPGRFLDALAQGGGDPEKTPVAPGALIPFTSIFEKEEETMCPLLDTLTLRGCERVSRETIERLVERRAGSLRRVRMFGCEGIGLKGELRRTGTWIPNKSKKTSTDVVVVKPPVPRGPLPRRETDSGFVVVGRQLSGMAFCIFGMYELMCGYLSIELQLPKMETRDQTTSFCPPSQRSRSTMLLDVNRKLFARSDRVKSVDLHPTEPWLLTGLYNGQVNIYNTETSALIKTFEVAEVPVRCVRFITRKSWFVAGSDDFQLRAFNYNTHEKVAAFEAHPDYIRCLSVHPVASLVLTGSDDMTIKAWDWDKGWKCVQLYEGHTHYIMNIAVNPKDPNTFASACLDRTVKVWSLGNPTPNFTLDAHEKGVNYVEYYHGADKPYIVTTGDDRTVKVWDYHAKSCIQTLEGHTANVSFAIFHPLLPVIVSGSEDGTVKIWHANTYRLENTLSYSLERAWCVGYKRNSNDVAVGFDEGVVVVKLGREEPSFSMDQAGKIVFARNNEVLGANLQTTQEDPTPDGQKLPLAPRELGSTEIFPSTIAHSPNGRFVAVCGDNEYIIYTALAWRNKSFGQGTAFAWAEDSNTYAVLEGKQRVKVYKNFKEKSGSGLKGLGGWAIDGLHGGTLLSARSGAGFVVFWDWESGEIVRRIEADAKNIYWSPNGALVAITSDDSFYVLKFDRDAYVAALEQGPVGDEGVEDAFELVAEIPESVKTAKWVGDCFVYTNSTNRLSYVVGSQTHTVQQFDSPMFVLGYMPTHNRIYVVDQAMNIFGYSLSLALVEYQTAVLRGDLDAAAELLPTVPQDQRNKIARFLEAQDLKELALQVSTDPDHKFDLAIQLDDLTTALTIAQQTPSPENETKWKAVGDRALAAWKFTLAKECFEKAGDTSSLLLLLLACADRDGLKTLSGVAAGKGQNNIAFASLLQLGDAKACAELLVKTDRAPEAALFARTYAPSKFVIFLTFKRAIRIIAVLVFCTVTFRGHKTLLCMLIVAYAASSSWPTTPIYPIPILRGPLAINSYAPTAARAWRDDLDSHGKPKIADMIVNPNDNPELFEEGWEAALAKEEGRDVPGDEKEEQPHGENEDGVEA
ncbi:Coatomer subunit delta [Rhizoctonia solani]|uniref:Beta'-coat protein n=1 Tax=Rhizoctonia solani TaxID=456999 RepID=A0A8H7HBP0_9AGAM|nr:Coatomer subunit delta [Rhizoctonia solani]